MRFVLIGVVGRSRSRIDWSVRVRRRADKQTNDDERRIDLLLVCLSLIDTKRTRTKKAT
jgi:hypothetical protein